MSWKRWSSLQLYFESNCILCFHSHVSGIFLSHYCNSSCCFNIWVNLSFILNFLIERCILHPSGAFWHNGFSVCTVVEFNSQYWLFSMSQALSLTLDSSLLHRLSCIASLFQGVSVCTMAGEGRKIFPHLFSLFSSDRQQRGHCLIMVVSEILPKWSFRQYDPKITRSSCCQPPSTEIS